MVEIRNVTQTDGEPLRRWFADNDHDLIVWFDERDGICGFRFCYDKRRVEHAVTWLRAEGFSHDRVDHGRKNVQKEVPILVPADRPCPADIVERFRAASAQVDAGIVSFVCAKMRKCLANPAP